MDEDQEAHKLNLANRPSQTRRAHAPSIAGRASGGKPLAFHVDPQYSLDMELTPKQAEVLRDAVR